jgi:hypothetical protein
MRAITIEPFFESQLLGGNVYRAGTKYDLTCPGIEAIEA